MSEWIWANGSRVVVDENRRATVRARRMRPTGIEYRVEYEDRGLEWCMWPRVMREEREAA